MHQPLLEVTGLYKHYDSRNDRNEVLHDVNFKVEEGEFIAIVGYSGAGKTSLISQLAGLEKPSKGGVLFRGREIQGPDADRAVVFQSYSLLPWLSVAGNVTLAVNATAAKLSRAQRNERVDHYIDMVGLSHARDRKPAELSGGMRQRVSVARALAMQSPVLLLDEPLSALDALSRARLQDELAAISEQEKRTIVLVTNDVDEAILLADRVLTLSPAPAATIGQTFEVNLTRPRIRAEMNSDSEFVRLRNDITRYLLSMVDNISTTTKASTEPPHIVPIARHPKYSRFPSRKQVPKTATENTGNRYLQFSAVSKVFPTTDGPLKVVDEFELSMNKGEFITLIGHSGCGKSTVLSMASGLNASSSGGVVLDGQHISHAGPDKAVVFQSPSLMPWMTAFDNVSLGVNRVFPKASKAERRDICEYYLERVGLADAMHRSATDMSNGMQQRVGIARAFALSPKLLLLDEPFGMLDSLTRWELQDVLMDVWSQTKVTAICVTHDVDEAILLADRVVMMSNGPNARVGNIMDVALERPRSRAALLSHPDYYAYREELLSFLVAYEGGANPEPELLEAIANKRKQSVRVSEDEKIIAGVASSSTEQPFGQADAQYAHHAES